MEKRRQEQAEHGLVLKSFDPETKFLEFVPIIPLLPENYELSHEIERIEREGTEVRKNLIRMNQESAIYNDNVNGSEDNTIWNFGDAYITEITIIPDTHEMNMVIDNTTDYTESTTRSVRA